LFTNTCINHEIDTRLEMSPTALFWIGLSLLGAAAVVILSFRFPDVGALVPQSKFGVGLCVCVCVCVCVYEIERERVLFTVA
jgi:hypothetical protein